MELEAVRRIAKAQPFRPFEILVDGGEKIVVKHPEAIWIAPTDDFIVVQTPRDGVEIFESVNISKIRTLPIRRNGRAAS